MRRLDELGPAKADRGAEIGNAKGDGKLTFDRLTDVFQLRARGTMRISRYTWWSRDLNLCSERCTQPVRESVPVFLPGGGVRDGGRVGHGIGCVGHGVRQCRTRWEKS